MPETAVKPALPTDYYRRNFVTVIDFVAHHYQDLLNDAELSLIERFQQCSSAAQCLYIRMLMRKGRLFRQDQLIYAEINNIGAAADELEQCGLIAINDETVIQEWLDLLRKHELAQLTGKSPRLSRELLLAQARLMDDQRIAAYFSGLAPVFLLRGNEEVDVITLCFFANTRQTLAEFVIRDLGIMRYETYDIDPQSRFFRSRAEIDEYRLFSQLRDKLEARDIQQQEGVDELRKTLDALPHTTTHPYLKRRVDRLTAHLLRDIERRVHPDEALRHYQQWQLRDTFERIARLHEKCGDAAAAYALCEQIIESQPLDREAEFIRKFSRKLAKTVTKTALLAELDYHPPMASVELPFSELPVEIVIQQHLSQNADCFYVENGLFTALFGLTFWPAIYASVPAAFVNSFQLAPKDLYDREFRSRRHALIEELRSLASDTDASIKHMLNMYQQKFGIDNNFVNWQLLDEQLLQLALQKIPPAHRLAVFDRMLQDLGNRCSGFPDLIVFDDNGYRLVEVKGPGDTLQDNQLSWMRYFAQHGIAHEVLHVRWRE